MRKVWTKENDDTLLRMVRLNCSIDDIAYVTGFQPATIYKKVRKVYGMECGRSLLFEFDPFDGPYGSTRLVADMALESQIKEHRFPYATLAVGFSPDRRAYYGLVNRAFDYSAEDQETEAMTRTFLLRCDLDTGKKENLGQMVSDDGRIVLGLGGCEVASDGKIYFCGAIAETNQDKVAGLAV